MVNACKTIKMKAKSTWNSACFVYSIAKYSVKFDYCINKIFVIHLILSNIYVSYLTFTFYLSSSAFSMEYMQAYEEFIS